MSPSESSSSAFDVCGSDNPGMLRYSYVYSWFGVRPVFSLEYR